MFKNRYPIIPLRDLVLFPNMVVRLFVGREKSINALEEALKTESKVLLISQRRPEHDDPMKGDLYDIGVTANVLQVVKLQDGTVKTLIEGVERVRVKKFYKKSKYLEASIEVIPDILEEDKEQIGAMIKALYDEFERYVKLNKKINPEILKGLANIQDITQLTNIVSAHILQPIIVKQELLEMEDVYKRLGRLLVLLQSENADKTIKQSVLKKLADEQTKVILNQHLRALQEELGDKEGREELIELETKINTKKLSKEAKEKLLSELKKLKSMNPMSSEANIARTYINIVLELPWNEFSKINPDLKKAKDILDNNHYGLDEIKETVLEYIAVKQRKDKANAKSKNKNKKFDNEFRGQILCLVGPPGVGKTQLSKSIAEALGLSFAKASMGGLKDESEIKGHRRTYIGAMPGKVIQAMKKAGTSNPLILLDEIDKMGYDFRGDPAAALLEVLDPEQNNAFNDHYVEIDYDLSNVTFVCTANSYNIPRPLLDRMEVVAISGYTEDDKAEIAKKYLLPKQMAAHSLDEDEIEISEGVIRDIVRYYTREAGVRSLNRDIAKICRKVVKELMINSKLKEVMVTPKNLDKFLGVRKFDYGAIEKEDQIGVVNGLAYTEVGGDLLVIEAIMLPGKGDFKVTGKLGEVMRESIQAATSYVRSKALEFGINPSVFKEYDMHLHVPEGAVPKEGPSAGIAMCTAIVSLLAKIPVKKTVAMTGEITLRGKVLPIGGLKEKLLAALRGGVKTVIIPKQNAKDLKDMPENILKQLTIKPVETAEEVLKIALSKKMKPITMLNEETVLESTDKGSTIVTH